MRSGEIWWARLDGRTPVVLLGAGAAVRVVAPATAGQKRGFVVLSGAEAVTLGHAQITTSNAAPS
jgi:hypothetical protein